jgi:hypothetical protein
LTTQVYERPPATSPVTDLTSGGQPSPRLGFRRSTALTSPDDGFVSKRSIIERAAPLSDPTVRSLWLAITTLAAVLVGTVSGLLGWAGGMNAPTAVLTGGSAFAGTILLILTALRFTAGQAE